MKKISQKAVAFRKDALAWLRQYVKFWGKAPMGEISSWDEDTVYDHDKILDELNDVVSTLQRLEKVQDRLTRLGKAEKTKGRTKRRRSR
jgi:phosphoserine phosphatase